MKKERKPRPSPDSFTGIVPAPFGAVGFKTDGEMVTGVSFMPGHTIGKTPADAFAREVARQLAAYLADAAFLPDFPVVDAGTDFQRKVWREMRKIPAGKARTYGDVAGSIGSGPRAVGGACAANPLVLYYPCHRIVAAGGIGGFSGETAPDNGFLRIKQWLLRHEGFLR